MTLIGAIGVFFLLFVTDWLWAAYVRRVAARESLPAAACYSVGLVFAGAVSTILYVEHHWMILPACAGAFAGTWAGLKRS